MQLRDYQQVVFDQEKKMGHKHASLMMQYALDSEKNVDAFMNWQYKPLDNFGEWLDCIEQPDWNPNFEYRRKPSKPNMITINGREILSPLADPPQYMSRCYLVSLDGYNFYSPITWHGDSAQERHFERGLIHLTKDAAVEHSKAIISFTEKSNVE